MADHEIRVRSFARGTDEDQRTGLVGWISVYYGRLVLDGITVRRTVNGEFRLSFPTRTDHAGKRHAYIRPVDDAARRAIEAAVFREAAVAPEVDR